MSNTNNTMQTQTSSTLHNVIMEAGGKDRLQCQHLMLATPVIPDSEEVVRIILTGIDNEIFSTVDACPNAMEMWKAIESLKHGSESLESYYSCFYKILNELVRNKCIFTNHQVNVQFLLQLKPGWKRFATIVNQNQDFKNVSYQKLYDILKQRQNEVNEIKDERLAHTANPLALVS
ncbi:hypothetical protein Tco_0523215 [Tanacetum coccineum]